MAPPGQTGKPKRRPNGTLLPKAQGGGTANPTGINGYVKIRTAWERILGVRCSNQVLELLAMAVTDPEGLSKDEVPGRRLQLEALGLLRQQIQLEHTAPPASPEYLPSDAEAEALLADAQGEGLVH